MRVGNEAALAKNESAIDRLVASNEKAIGGLRKDMEKLINTLTIRIIVVVGLGFAVLALILK